MNPPEQRAVVGQDLLAEFVALAPDGAARQAEYPLNSSNDQKAMPSHCDDVQ